MALLDFLGFIQMVLNERLEDDYVENKLLPVLMNEEEKKEIFGLLRLNRPELAEKLKKMFNT